METGFRPGAQNALGRFFPKTKEAAPMKRADVQSGTAKTRLWDHILYQYEISLTTSDSIF
jgi:hypothetical protein